MDSSTSHSNSKVPWQSLKLLGVACIAWGVGAFYTMRVNPEVAFYRHGDQVKQDWSRKLEREQGAKIVVYGGSSCATTIDGERMLREHRLPVVNLGMHAGMGAKMLTYYALQDLRPGDTLIVSIEQGLLNTPIEIEPLGVQLAFATGNVKLLRDPDRVDWLRCVPDLQPGGYHTFTMLGKIVARQPLYRYQPNEFHASGWQEVRVKRDVQGFDRFHPELSPDGRELLTFIRRYCDEHRVRVAYSLPWSYVAPDKVAGFQQDNIKFIRQVSEFIPVLMEPRLGAYSVREQFADTGLHLTPEGAAIRSDELAEAIIKWQVWSGAELDDIFPAKR